MSSGGVDVRRLDAEALLALQAAIPAWNSGEYAKRLGAQDRFAHGPFITSTDLWDDSGQPIPVGAVMIYVVKELG